MKRVMLFSALLLVSLAGFSHTKGLIEPGKPLFKARGLKNEMKLIDIIASVDKTKIDPATADGERAKDHLATKNEEIIKYIKTKYQFNDISDPMDAKDNATTIFGLVCTMYEENEFKPFSSGGEIAHRNLPAWLECTFSVLGAVSGVSQILQELGTFSWGSTWKLVKFVVKKYGLGWFGTISAVYAVITTCF
jgi:hypothetical protein